MAPAAIADNGPPDQLTGANAPVSASATLHENRVENGVMMMRDVPALPLGTGKTLTLAPGGYHVMLVGLKRPLRAGGSFPLTLTFEHAPAVTVQVRVEPVGASSARSEPMGGMDIGGMPMGARKP